MSKVVDIMDKKTEKIVTFRGNINDHDRLKDVVWHAQQKGHNVSLTSALGFGMKLASDRLAKRLGFESLDDVPAREGALRNGRPPAESEVK